MNINVEEIVSDNYELIARDGYVFGVYPTIADAVKNAKNYSKKFICNFDMKIRHKLTAYIDETVDCKELFFE